MEFDTTANSVVLPIRR